MKKILFILVPLLAMGSLTLIVGIALTFNMNTPVTANNEVPAVNLSTGTGNGTDWPMVNYD